MRFLNARSVVTSLIFCTALLAGCASIEPTESRAPLFADASFTRPAKPITAREIFALSPEMRTFLNALRADNKSALYVKGPQQGLLDALYFFGESRIDYDAAVTRNAAEAFAAKSGNCLSLVVMTAAFAREMDIPVTFQRVPVDETWSRANGLLLAAGHVNVVLGKRPIHTLTTSRTDHDALTVDFFPPGAINPQMAKPIEERTVIAMFMNNRAAEALVAGDRDLAYWWAREAITQDGAYLPALNTLGVIYRRHGLTANAETVMREILRQEQTNANALANLAVILRDQGKIAEATSVETKLAAVSQFGEHAPFHFFHLGMAEVRLGEWARARDLFRTELKKNPQAEEVHYWLARAYTQLGDTRRAREHLALAIQHGTTPERRDIYAAKREHLRSVAR
jgi:Tfp pilus assembly protein PilF